MENKTTYINLDDPFEMLQAITAFFSDPEVHPSDKSRVLVHWIEIVKTIVVAISVSLSPEEVESVKGKESEALIYPWSILEKLVEELYEVHSQEIDFDEFRKEWWALKDLDQMAHSLDHPPLDITPEDVIGESQPEAS